MISLPAGCLSTSALVRITHNELLLIAFNTIRTVYEDYTEYVFERGYRDQSFVDHAAIIDALRRSDAETITIA